MKTKINYVVGDATAPLGTGLKVIGHVCNNVGAWGHGFVMALSKKWKEPENDYHVWFKEETKPQLGEVCFVPVEGDIVVANMIGQVMGFGTNGEPPVRYEAIRQALKIVADYCLHHNASFHCPRIGCGLAGGSWEVISQIIHEELCDKGIDVTVYEFLDKTSPFFIQSNK